MAPHLFFLRLAIPCVITIIANSIAAQQVPSLVGPQQSSRCSSSSHRQFDFWIGEWEVSDSLNRRLGTNRIERVLDGCVLYESWSGATGARGHSFNAFDPGDNKWHQTWVDNEGTVLMISGGIVNGEMVMEGERRLADGSQTLERISWSVTIA